ncbi:MAG: adenylate/guanylate cyclase domain-containing protein [Burkholderiaceae bacterium]
MDFSTLSMTEIIRLQSLLQQELTRRFERPMALAFSDIEGSTSYFARFGDAAGRQLQQLHVDLLEECVSPHGGRIVDTAGDGAFLAFSRADPAAQALIDFNKRISRENAARAREHQLRVRIGMHVGPVLTDGVVVSGDAVNICSRVAASATSGELRLTREAFQDFTLAHRLSCRQIGPVDLKGVPHPVELLALDWLDHSMFPSHFRIEETQEMQELPSQDIVSFGRLREHEGRLANDVVLMTSDPLLSRQISRWHFELRRHPDGIRLRSMTNSLTEVDGQAVTKGHEVEIKPGTRISVARVLTLTLLSPTHARRDDADATRLVT